MRVRFNPTIRYLYNIFQIAEHEQVFVKRGEETIATIIPKEEPRS